MPNIARGALSYEAAVFALPSPTVHTVHVVQTAATLGVSLVLLVSLFPLSLSLSLSVSLSVSLFGLCLVFVCVCVWSLCKHHCRLLRVLVSFRSRGIETSSTASSHWLPPTPPHQNHCACPKHPSLLASWSMASS